VYNKSGDVMKYVYVLNRFSLKDKLNPLVEKIKEVSKKRKMDYLIEINNDKTSTEDIVRKYKKEKVTFLAVGGDGTINRIVNSMNHEKNILGIIPSGTGNDFNRACLELIKKKETKIDLIKINQKFFINVACFGIDADIGNNSNIVHSKWIPEKQGYNISLLVHFVKYKTKPAKVFYNDKTWEDEMTTIAICNGRYYGGGYKVGYQSFLDNGTVDLYMVNKMNKLQMATLIMGMNKGRHEHSPHTTKVQVKKCTIEFEKPVTGNIDGEEITAKKFEVEVIPKGVTIYYDRDLIADINTL
jgi:YegS/Rv2252/BmrU family lipid kinase